MKFAVITDIHGNAPALKAVLAEIDHRQDIDQIVCLGDMVAIGPDTNEILGMLFSRDDVSMITGNHDEAVLALRKGEAHPGSHSHVKAHHHWIAERIDAEYISRLERLPRFIRQEISGHSILFTHYHVDADKAEAPISRDPFARIVQPSLANMEELFDGEHADLICFGHHHPVHYFRGMATTYFNPGSLGCADRPIARYGVVSVDAEGICVELLDVAYDNVEFLLSFERLGVPEREFILRAFYGDPLKNRTC